MHCDEAPRPGAPACQALFRGPRCAGSPAPPTPCFRASMALSARSASRRIGHVAGVAVPLAQGPGPPARLSLRRRQAAARCCLTADLGPPWPRAPRAAGHRFGGVQHPSPPPLCRCGSGAVGTGPPLSAAGQRPAKALALLPPSVGGIPPSVARCRPLLLPLDRTSGGRTAQGGPVRSSASCGRPARPGRRQS